MRESEFCIPANNKAVISITPNWYDRRALDTRSNYALYSSLSHLANLCQTSPKVRESLACDGGLEQLVRILKQGKLCYKPEMFQLSKWQQSLLCIVNVGVRGSETIRNRVIEAGVVPITVTILCNALEHIIQSHRAFTMPAHIENFLADDSTFRSDVRMSGIDISRSREHAALHRSRAASPSRNESFDGPQQTMMNRVRMRPQVRVPRVMTESFVSAEPLSGPLNRYRNNSNVMLIGSTTFGDGRSENNDIDNIVAESDAMDFVGSPRILSGVVDETDSSRHERHGSELSNEDNFSQSTRNDGEQDYHSMASRSRTYSQQTLQNADGTINLGQTQAPRMTSRMSTTWDQDVTLCLKLLAYLSKYPYLRPEFSQSHDVPRLRQNLKQFEMHYNSKAIGTFDQLDDDLSDAFQVPSNVFQLVEKFTMRIHVSESTYWAGVIMRNSCRRHEQGGIRQCAYLECGKWETQNRQFAKCRRCRRTKYCSKACQSKAWTGHRYWCSSSNPPADSAT